MTLYTDVVSREVHGREGTLLATGRVSSNEMSCYTGFVWRIKSVTPCLQTRVLFGAPQSMIERENPFLEKALESFKGAESEFSNERYDNAANRAYYASFQAAIAALQHAGVRPPSAQWSHGFVQGQFEGLLINRRHLYPTALRGVLGRNAILRLSADYAEEPVTRTETDRALRRSRAFVQAIWTTAQGSR